jgi:tol-pal system protein YbgF
VRAWLKPLAPVAFLATGACFATRTDVRVLQNDLAVMRQEAAERDSRQRARIDSLLGVLAVVNDSVRAANTRMVAFQVDVREDLYSLGQNLLTVQELTGQSQRRLQELRASLEQQSLEIQAAAAQSVMPAPGDSGAPVTPVAPPPPGPNQLLQLGQDQLRRTSYTTARRAFEDILQQYPESDIAPEALYYIGYAYSEERNTAAADSVYALVVQRYPESIRAATSLYRRALIKRERNDIAGARAMLEEIIRRWPRTDEALLAADLLKTIR